MGGYYSETGAIHPRCGHPEEKQRAYGRSGEAPIMVLWCEKCGALRLSIGGQPLEDKWRLPEREREPDSTSR